MLTGVDFAPKLVVVTVAIATAPSPEEAPAARPVKVWALRTSSVSEASFIVVAFLPAKSIRIQNLLSDRSSSVEHRMQK